MKDYKLEKKFHEFRDLRDLLKTSAEKYSIEAAYDFFFLEGFIKGHGNTHAATHCKVCKTPTCGQSGVCDENQEQGNQRSQLY